MNEIKRQKEKTSWLVSLFSDVWLIGKEGLAQKWAPLPDNSLLITSNYSLIFWKRNNLQQLKVIITRNERR